MPAHNTSCLETERTKTVSCERAGDWKHSPAKLLFRDLLQSFNHSHPGEDGLRDKEEHSYSTFIFTTVTFDLTGEEHSYSTFIFTTVTFDLTGEEHSYTTFIFTTVTFDLTGEEHSYSTFIFTTVTFDTTGEEHSYSTFIFTTVTFDLTGEEHSYTTFIFTTVSFDLTGEEHRLKTGNTRWESIPLCFCWVWNSLDRFLLCAKKDRHICVNQEVT